MKGNKNMEENNLINSNIGLQIKKEREKKGWTQTELGEKVFVSQQTQRLSVA